MLDASYDMLMAMAACGSISCGDVKNWSNGGDITVQRYLGWTAIVNLNNYLYTIYNSLYKAATLSSLVNADLVTASRPPTEEGMQTSNGPVDLLYLPSDPI